MEVKIMLDESSIIKTIPFEIVLDDGRELKGNIVETVTSVGGLSQEDIEVEWDEEYENPEEISDDEILEEYHRMLIFHAYQAKVK